MLGKKYVEAPRKAQDHFVLYDCTGVEPVCRFMPETCLKMTRSNSGWVQVNENLQVVDRMGNLMGYGRIFAAGDCTHRMSGDPTPKRYANAEQQVRLAVANMRIHDQAYGGRALAYCFVFPALSFRELSDHHSKSATVEQGIFFIRMGKADGVAIVGGSGGRVVATGKVVPRMKELQEASQMRAIRGNRADGAFWSILHQVIRGVSNCYAFVLER